MRTFVLRPIVAASALLTAGSLLTVGLALHPATASPNPNGSVTCTNSVPCQTYKNKGTGAGLQGTNTNTSPSGAGLVGSATGNGDGVNGFANTGVGVFGNGASAGVEGSGGTYGVYGVASASGAIGVRASSNNGDAVSAYSSCCNGINAGSGSGNGIASIAGSGGYGLFAVGTSLDAIVGTTPAVSYYGVRGINTAAGYGGYFSGGYGGIIGVGDAGGFPLVLEANPGGLVAWVDGSGNIGYHGSLMHFIKTRDEETTFAFTPTSASPTIEDNGSAQLVNGVATVQLDSTFARAIDGRRKYQIMLTPDGDTKGLYVASKSPTAFVVREVQGGRGTLEFDYHIYAPSLGQATQRMTSMTAAQAKAMMPHVSTTPLGPRPTLDVKQPPRTD